MIDAIRQFDAITGVEQLTTVLGSAVRAANAQLTAKARPVPTGRDGVHPDCDAVVGSSPGRGAYWRLRAYLLRDRVLRQITEDHVLRNLVAAPMPASISGYLVRYLDARPGWSPDLTLRAVQPGDRYLICSDGLNGFADPDAIRAVLADDGDADQTADGLISLAYAAGAPDNVTVIIVDVPGGTWEEREGNPLVVGAAAELASRS